MWGLGSNSRGREFDYKRKAHGRVPVGGADEHSERSVSGVDSQRPPIKRPLERVAFFGMGALVRTPSGVLLARKHCV